MRSSSNKLYELVIMMSSHHTYVIFTCFITCKVLRWFISGLKLPTKLVDNTLFSQVDKILKIVPKLDEYI